MFLAFQCANGPVSRWACWRLVSLPAPSRDSRRARDGRVRDGPASRRAARGARARSRQGSLKALARSRRDDGGTVDRRGVRPDGRKRRRRREPRRAVPGAGRRRVSWCIDTVKHPFLDDQPGYFCDWCLCKACDVCTNLASRTRRRHAEVCVPTKENKERTTGPAAGCAKTGAPTRQSPILVEQPGHFCDWCLCKACDVCTNLASPSPPPSTVRVRPDASKGRRVRRRAVSGLVYRPVEHRSNTGLLLRLVLCKACDVCTNLASPSPPPATAGRASRRPEQSQGRGRRAVPRLVHRRGDTGEPNRALLRLVYCKACRCAHPRRRRRGVRRDANRGDGSGEQCQDWCTDPSKHDTDFLTAQPRFFCDWCYCKACDVCAPTAAPATTVPASTVAAAACVPTQKTTGRRRAVPRLVHRPGEHR